jgi:hypothetical protein
VLPGLVGNTKASKVKHGTFKYMLSAIIPMESCAVEIVDDANSCYLTQGGRFDYLLLIARNDSKLEWGLSRFLISCSTAKEQEMWFFAIQACITESGAIATQ